MDAFDESLTISDRSRSSSQYKTVRTVLHERKSEIIPGINKSIAMKDGAERLARIATRKELKAKAAIEVDTEYSRLKGLKDEFDALNSSFSTYQIIDSHLPMIAVGLKFTRPVDFVTPFSDFVESHYHEDASKFQNAFRALEDMREKIRQPLRSSDGLKNFRNYYKLFNTIERRFFDGSTRLYLRFHWSDSFTGEEHSQRSAAFEKGAVLFNFAALCSQIAVSIPPDSSENLNQRIDYFLQCRSSLYILQENFAHAPSKDMCPAILNILFRITTLQIQECIFFKSLLENGDNDENENLAFFLSGANTLSEQYGKLASSPNAGNESDWNLVLNILPSAWIGLIDIKSKYYQAQANHKLALALFALSIDRSDSEQSVSLFESEDSADSEALVALDRLFSALKTVITLHNSLQSSQSNKHGKRLLHRTHSAFGARSRSSRPLSRISLRSWGRSKSQPEGLNEESRHSSKFSRKSSYSSVATSNFSAAPLPVELPPPSNCKDAFLLGCSCLAEAINWMDLAVLQLHSKGDLRDETDLKTLITEYRTSLVNDQIESKRKGIRLGWTVDDSPEPQTGPAPKPTQRRINLGRPKSSARSSSAVSVCNNPDNMWCAPAFSSVEIVIPADTNKPLNSGMLKQDQDPLRLLGPLDRFNAKKLWSPKYYARLVRDDLVGYGFSIQGASPVEILGVDLDTPATENGLCTGDLILEINKLDARFMSHNSAVAAIRFGPNATGNLETDAASLPELDYVELALVHPVAPTVTISIPDPVPETPKPAQRHKKHIIQFPSVKMRTRRMK